MFLTAILTAAACNSTDSLNPDTTSLPTSSEDGSTGEVQAPAANDLALATYGRGMWILDDITPLRQLTSAVLASDAQLLAPRAAYRFRNVEAPRQQFYDPVAGQDPPYGAAINYWTFVRTPDGWRIKERFNREVNGSEAAREFMGKVDIHPSLRPAAEPA